MPVSSVDFISHSKEQQHIYRTLSIIVPEGSNYIYACIYEDLKEGSVNIFAEKVLEVGNEKEQKFVFDVTYVTSKHKICVQAYALGEMENYIVIAENRKKVSQIWTFNDEVEFTLDPVVQ